MKIRVNGRDIGQSGASNEPQKNTQDSISQPICIEDSETGAPKCLLPETHTATPNQHLYRLYFSDDIKAVCRGDICCLVEEASHKITTPSTSGSSTPYYWRVDTVLTSGVVMEGRVWSI